MNTNDKSLVSVFQKLPKSKSDYEAIGRAIMNGNWPSEFKLPSFKLNDRIEGYSGFGLNVGVIDVYVSQNGIYFEDKYDASLTRLTPEQAELQAEVFKQAAKMKRLLVQIDKGLEYGQES